MQTVCATQENISVELKVQRLLLFFFYTGCSLNIVFLNFFKNIPDSGLSLFSKAGRTPALQQNWQSSEKFQDFNEKHNN